MVLCVVLGLALPKFAAYRPRPGGPEPPADDSAAAGSEPEPKADGAAAHR